MELSEVDAKNGKYALLMRQIIACLLIVGLGLISLLLLRMHSRSYWLFSCFMVGVDALACIFLAGWGRLGVNDRRWSRIWRAVFHWVGFAVILWLLNDLIDMGTFLSSNAGLILLGLLGFTIYLSGLYTDYWLVVMGIVLVLMAMSAVWAHQHFWLLMIPLVVVAILVLVLVGHVAKKKRNLI